MAVFYLNHTALGKSKYDKQGAVAHAGYILRGKACVEVGSQHMPSEYRQVLGWVGRLYDSTRKNARVYDKIILSLPRELSQVEHVELLRKFCHAVTKGEAPYLFAIHGDKPDNPHAHVIIRDASIHNGKRVALLSETGSTYKLRAIWERLNNEALAQKQVAISRWGKESPQHEYLNAQAKRGPTVQAYDTVLTAEKELAELRHYIAQLNYAESEYAKVTDMIAQAQIAVDKTDDALKLAVTANDRAIEKLEPHKMWLLFAPLLSKLGLYRRRIEKARTVLSHANAAEARMINLRTQLDDERRASQRKEIYRAMVQKDIQLYVRKLALYGDRHDVQVIQAELVARIHSAIARIEPDKLSLEQKQKVLHIHQAITV